MFDQKQIAEFKEAFSMIDHDNDGFIDKEDLKDMLASLGQSPTEEYIDDMMAEAPGSINFTMFLTLMGEKLSGTDPEHEILQAFEALDERSLGSINADDLREYLTTMGDRFTDDEVDILMKGAKIDHKNNFNYREFLLVEVTGDLSAVLMSEESDVPVYLGHYRVEKTLGQGSYGKVKLATNVKTGQKVALKFILKSNIKKPVHMTRIKREVRLLKLLNHPHIVKLYEVAETNQEIILTTEYASGGELFDYIVAQHRLKEKEARKIFRQIVSAVDYCHANCIIHRDLKPENLLLDVDRNIKIIDFGFANMFDPEGLMGTFCGSPFYASPEMILGKKYIGPEVDIWSMGVILYALLCGHLPFDDSNMKKLYNKIIEGKFNIPDYVSTSARDLITKMIVVDTNTRTTLKDVKSHPWISEDCDGPPENFLPERKVPEALDDAALGKLATYGFDLESSKHKILSDPHSPAFSTYYLILEKNRRESELSNNAKSQPEKIEPPIQSEAKENDSKKDADKEASTSKRRARTLTGGDTAKVQ
ncbi:Pkinase-domain-containing protein, partial [Rozella allomycis CSF55]